jgi:Flp pilus assembly protein TadG
MKAVSSMAKLRTQVRRFTPASGGNVVTMFALSIVPGAGAVGAALDFSQANSVKTAMQAASDVASLGTIKVASTLTAGQIQTTAAGLFNSSFNRPGIIPTVTTSFQRRIRAERTLLRKQRSI